ncbi:ThrRS/AlaRS common domain-containing protein [Schizopora paradoxa]|uniref:ThrRS/AlaRS common domain-containing protein n=1 Tax=Schizopora paradoxa TaxID=27342 RepID=A0A0H2RZN8_9AGAM|nr:ThrRS/AlaRS common domain-containing protein [Schizopora paradoxa]
MAAAAIVLPPTPLTPPTYHRIISPSLSLPTNEALPVPVGLLACQRDPLLRELSTSVISCTLQNNPSQAEGAKSKKKASSTTAGTKEKTYEVILHDTVLFPEGGGQPSDTGVLRIEQGVELEVVEVRRVGGHAVHHVRAKDELLLAPGDKVTTILDEKGFSRRLDHMCMHTSQHLLSALLETHLELPTLSWALTTYPTPSYVELPRALTLEEIARIQSLAHTLAYEGRAVHVEVEPLAEDNRPGVATVASGRTVGKALPQDYTGGVKRTVVIDGVDRNPCCGTHLPSLSNLQLFLLPQTESLTRGATSTARLFFLCGPRLHVHLNSSHNLLTKTAGIMSCGAPDVPERVNQAVDERRRLDKRAEELEAELAKIVSAQLLVDPSNETVIKRHYHRNDEPSRALGFLQCIASSCLSSAEVSEKKYCFVLTSSPVSQTSTSVTSVLIVSPDEKLVKMVGDLLKSEMSVRGGGKGTRWSGKWVGVWKDAKEGKLVEEILSRV